MGSEWIECTLGDYLTFKNGKSSPEREAAAEKPVYGANGVIGFSDQVNTQSQSLVIGRVGTYCGSVYHTSSDCWVTDNAISCVPKISGESEFWYFKLLALHLNSHRTGSGQPLLNQGILNSISTGIPKEHSVRYSIGKFLMDFDNKIALNRQINTTLESMAQALFKSWFVDFDPVIDNALAAGNEIPDELAARAARREALRQQTNKTTETTDAASSEQTLPETGLTDQCLPPEIQQLFPDRFVLTDEMGWVPEGWGVKSVRDVCSKVQNGGTPKRDVSEYWENGDIPWLASGEVRQDIVIKTEQKISELGLINSSAKWLPALSTVVAMYGATAGEVSFIAEKLTTNQAVCGLIPKSGVEYYLYLAMSRITTELANQARGSAQQNISKGIIEQTTVIEPLSTALAEFNRIVAPKFSKRIENLKQIDCLANLRDSLLPKLLSGQLTIPDAEQQLAEVL